MLQVHLQLPHLHLDAFLLHLLQQRLAPQLRQPHVHRLSIDSLLRRLQRLLRLLSEVLHQVREHLGQVSRVQLRQVQRRHLWPVRRAGKRLREHHRPQKIPLRLSMRDLPRLAFEVLDLPLWLLDELHRLHLRRVWCRKILRLVSHHKYRPQLFQLRLELRRV